MMPMDWYWILLIVLTVTVVLPVIGSATIVPPIVFDAVLKRSRPDKWSRDVCSDPKNEGIVYMWNESLRFREKYAENEVELSAVTEDGLHLEALYYDFGSDTAVIILPGRPEPCIYSLYYAFPYAEKKVNVLAMDVRSHGLSEGTYSGCGYMEQFDVLAYIKLLEERGVKRIILHGVCVGSSIASFVAARPDCPASVKAIITDGLYVHFYETLKRRIAQKKGMVYPAIFYFRHRIKKMYGTDILKEGPIVNVTKFRIPCLMMASKEDIFSLPKKTQKLFNLNASPEKELVWFEHGPHSHLRRVDTEKYDSCVNKMIEKVANRD